VGPDCHRLSRPNLNLAGEAGRGLVAGVTQPSGKSRVGRLARQEVAALQKETRGCRWGVASAAEDSREPPRRSRTRRDEEELAVGDPDRASR
jgi:hypothetical protein